MSAENTLHTLLDKTTWREEVDKTGWETRPLGEVFAVRQGFDPAKIAAYWENGTIPFVKMEDVRQ
ncbi:MAG: restriction endonuclease subunit S, partial [Acetobacter sp.]|nr:restriction endonuclease subunit S [Acetobacter sp.]